MTIHQPNLTGDGDDAFRASVVGGSEVSALFGANPWLTEFELWHRKNGTVATPDFAHNERAKWGVRLEPVIVQAACEEYGYTLAETPVRLENGKGLGGHPDQMVICPRRGRGLLEVKTADWLVAKGWGDEPPLNYLLQVQTYMGLAGVDWGEVVVLVGGNELRRFEYEFRPVIFADIEARVERFWQSIRENNPPPVDPERDCAALIEAIGAPDDSLADLRDDIHAANLAAEYLAAKQAEKDAALRADVAKCELLLKIGKSSAALLDGFKISATQTKDSAGILISDEMVGTYIGARKGYRRFQITEKK